MRFRGQLFHVDPLRHEVRHRIRLEVGDTPVAAVSLGEGFDSIWASFGLGLIRGASGHRRAGALRPPHEERRRSALPTDVAIGGGRVWLGRADGRLVSLDPVLEPEVVSVAGPSSIDALAFGHGAVWTVDVLAGTVTRLRSRQMRPRDRDDPGRRRRRQPRRRRSRRCGCSLAPSGTSPRSTSRTGRPRGPVQVGNDADRLAVGLGSDLGRRQRRHHPPSRPGHPPGNRDPVRRGDPGPRLRR